MTTKKNILSEKKITLNVVKTLEGNIVVRDHEDIDIIIVPVAKKIILLPKSTMHEDIYPIQKRFFNKMRENGVIMIGSESTGFIHNSFEAIYIDSQTINAIAVILLFVDQFIQEEKEIYSKMNEREEEIEKQLLSPSDEKSTEWGEIPDKELDGSQIKDPYRWYVQSWFGWRY